MHNGKSLTAKDGKLEEGTEVVQYDYQGLDSQKWILRSNENGGLIISPLNNLDVSISIKGNVANGSELILSNTKYNNNQIFNLDNLSYETRTQENLSLIHI